MDERTIEDRVAFLERRTDQLDVEITNRILEPPRPPVTTSIINALFVVALVIAIGQLTLNLIRSAKEDWSAK